MTRTRLVLVALAAATLAGTGWWWTHRDGATAPKEAGDTMPPPGPGGPPGAPGGRRGPGMDGPTPVVVTPVVRRDVDLTFDGIGTVQASASVTVRAQVDGRLMELGFKEGQEVAAGDVLARIDPSSYRAVWDQAVAKKDQDEAELRNARADLERYDRLVKTESGSRQQADTQRSTVAKLEAQLRIDQGQIDAARVNLDNCTITAPIAGRTGLRTVDVGNLVHASDSTGLVTIARLTPIAVAFTLPQQQLAAVLAAAARGPVPVEVLSADRNTVTDRGAIEVIDNLVDVATGTVKIKASLPNAERRLWPGQFVDVRVRVDVTRDALVVPTAAVQRSADGPYVWLLGPEDKATRRPIAVVRQDETRAVIASGIDVGDRVLVTGFARLTDGTRVKPSAPAEPGAAPSTTDAPVATESKSRRQPGEHRGNGERRSGAPTAPDAATPPGAAPAAPSATPPAGTPAPAEAPAGAATPAPAGPRP